MKKKNAKENESQRELLHSRKILPEIERKMVKGKVIEVIIGKEDYIYFDPETKKEMNFEDWKEKIKKLKKNKNISINPEEYKKEVSILDIKMQLIKRGVDEKKIKQPTERFLAVEIECDMLKKIADEIKGIKKIWLNKDTKIMLDVSNDTIKSTAVRNVFNSKGEGTLWAVIDTGIDTNNKHIKDAIDVERFQFDYTGEGKGDQNGHGTHVAGIIASRSERYPGIAPEARLCDFKVLDKNGNGKEYSVIQAMEKIRKINREAEKIIIHGVNISLGSSVEVASYGCGSSPVCQEADRLVDSGVIVCVAAGNDGHKILAAFRTTTAVEYFMTFMDLTITDPGNADKVITVGSVHKEKPHTYGISYFSSKGPTGDGRYKPDVVAPGEKIKSLGLSSSNEIDGVKKSGTSMSTPHVSGALALFLSVKKEFIGQPLKVKEILMDSCTDLERDRYFQGAGLIDIFRAIQAV